MVNLWTGLCLVPCDGLNFRCRSWHGMKIKGLPFLPSPPPPFLCCRKNHKRGVEVGRTWRRWGWVSSGSMNLTLLFSSKLRIGQELLYHILFRSAAARLGRSYLDFDIFLDLELITRGCVRCEEDMRWSHFPIHSGCACLLRCYWSWWYLFILQ